MYDYIVVGAGSAGCVLASRLSDDLSNRVLLLEAGPTDSKQEVRIPAAFSKLFHSDLDWNYRTDPEFHSGHRARFWPRGKVLGGSSSMNAMMYVRGHRSDYDQWRQLGNAGWSFDDVLPYFKKSERFEGADGDPAFHGTSGPLHVSSQRSPNPLAEAFIAAGQHLGLKRVNDINGPTQDGVGLTHVTQRMGRRWSTADAFLRPAMRRPNLQVETNCLVHRIVFSGKSATGVAYERGGSIVEAQAAREVILSAGAIGSPQVLMLSGVGPASDLQHLNIPVVCDLPGVGQNLQDHLSVAVTFECTQAITLASAESVGNLARYLILGRGPLTSNIGEAVGFIRTREGLAAPDIELILAPTFFMEHGASNPPGHGCTIGAILLHPQSRGSVIVKRRDPHAHPLIQPNYLSERNDLSVLLAGVRFARSLAAAQPFDAYRGNEVWPGVDKQSDEQLEAFIRDKSESLYHPVGTCRMGNDAMAVVDDKLRVRGITGLRVADASVMPTIIGGHTNAAAIMIGEKAADLIVATA